MAIVAWIILGLISGYLASKIANKTGEGFFGDIVLGVTGAVVGGWLFKTSGKVSGLHPVPGVTGLNLESVFVAVIGAVVLLVVFRAICR